MDRDVLRWLLALLAMVEPGIGSAYSQERKLETYGDWTLSCVIASVSGSVKSCGLVEIPKSDKQTPVIQIGLGRYATTDPLKISIEIPVNVWMPTGIVLLLDSRQPP